MVGKEKSQMTQKVTVNSEAIARKELRYPCVGIPVLYSPIDSDSAADLAACLYKAIAVDMSLSGLAFDVEQAMYAGDALQILLEKPDDESVEELASEVRWCQRLPSGRYRVGVTINASMGVMTNWSNAQLKEFVGKFDAPKEINIRCPACEQQTTFSFVSYQQVLSGNGVMPLYNCLSCGTTRSLTGILK